MSDLEARVGNLLKDTAGRQTLVDRLLGRSTWNRFVAAMVVGTSASSVMLMAGRVFSSYRDSAAYADVAVGSVAVSVLWLSLALIQVGRRLRALTTILERSGTLTQFVAGRSAELARDHGQLAG